MVASSLEAMSAHSPPWSALIGCSSPPTRSKFFLDAPVATRCLDHAPLLLRFDDGFHPKRRFRFESFLSQFDRFLSTVESVPRPDVDPLKTIDHLLRQTAKELKRWSAKAAGNILTQIQVAKEVIFRLEAAQDSRLLSPVEQSLRRFLKIRFFGLSSLERTIACQKSSMRWLHEGDANTKFFHLHANHRRRKNHITSLEVEGN